jgi:hypothetical protein
MAEKAGTEARDVIAAALAALYDGGTLKIYTGAQPATPDTAPSGTLVATITLPTPAFGSPTTGVVPKAGTWTTTAGADGDLTAGGWFRLADAAGDNPVDGATGATGSGAELEIDNLDIDNGQTVTVSSFSITQPSS